MRLATAPMRPLSSPVANMPTTAADVASVIREHLGDRAEQRKQAVDLALEAAADRAKMQSLLQPPASDSSSGVKPAFVPRPIASTPELEPASNATLDSALVTPAGAGDDGRRKRMMIIVAAAAAAASLFVGIIVIVALTRGGSEVKATGTASATAAPITPVTAASTAPRVETTATTTAAPPATSTAITPAATTTTTAVRPSAMTTKAGGAKPPPSASTKKTIDDGF